MLSWKVVLLSTGMLSTAVALRSAVPAAAAFLCAEVPRVYEAALAWLTPPCLYFVVNVIIISIAASSRFRKVAEDGGQESTPKVGAAVIRPEEEEEDDDLRHPPPVSFDDEGTREAAEDPAALLMAAAVDHQCGGAGGDAPEEKSVAAPEKEQHAAADEGGSAEEEEFAISGPSWTPRRRRETSGVSPAPAEKPLVSVHFASRRGSAAKSSLEGRALGVARPRKSETLESTWRAITDGRAMPLTRHLRKSDTVAAASDAHGTRSRDGVAAAAAAAATEKSPVRKSETFKERSTADPSPSPGGGGRPGRLRRDASLGRDELNRRVEAFIRKFNEEMRLQRQESFKRYMEMINRGAD